MTKREVTIAVPSAVSPLSSASVTVVGPWLAGTRTLLSSFQRELVGLRLGPRQYPTGRLKGTV